MRINVRDKGHHVAPAIKEYAEKRVVKLEKYFGHIHSVEIVISHSRGRHVAELNMEGDGFFFRAEDRCDEEHAAIDSVVDKMERQLKRFKDRIVDGRHRPGPVKEVTADRINGEPTAEVTDDEDDMPAVVRRKSVLLKPMSTQEASQRMELVGHSFFLFHNEETDRVSLLYKREDGAYGLIEPAN